MKIVIVLAMHGAPPNDFPPHEMGEFFGLHARLERATGDQRAGMERRYTELETKIRDWPRTPQNDPFFAASQELVVHLSQATGCQVVLGFNEFCAPTLDQALDDASALEASQVIVITPMMTRGGGHATVDIPEAIERAQERHPDTVIRYAWPFEVSDVARFLAAQIDCFV